MSIHVALTHRTSYRYERLITLGPQTIRLRPAPHCRTPILAYSLTVSPRPHFLNRMQDPQGNFLARVVFPERVDHFDVTVDLVADMATINPFDFFLEPEAEHTPFTYDGILDQELAPFRRLAPAGPLLRAFLETIPRGRMRTVEFLVTINARLAREISYIVRLEPGVWAPEETLGERRGSCRDTGWLLVQILRHLGFAARFCSGYLIQLVADRKPVDGPAGPGSDFTDLHAWCEVYLPGAGWVGLDPTSGLFAGEGHIPLAATPDPVSAAAITGLAERAGAAFSFEMAVTRIAETPRVTKPYSDAEWLAVERMGALVDRALSQGGVRLTMGGEPTFVSVSDRDAPEWNTEALGPTKRAMGGRLLRRLHALWSPGGVLQYGQGKWYPGEPLPRWAIHSHWRADGEPVWRDMRLLAADEDRDDATAADARRFAVSLAGRLGLDPAFATAAHEDIPYHLWREQRLPVNLPAEDAELADPMERARLARVFGQGLAADVGTVLPLRRIGVGEARRWQSERWRFRGGRLFLLPGDSPLGYRLPLESLPWPGAAPADAEPPPDPLAAMPALPPRHLLGDRAGRVLPVAVQRLAEFGPADAGPTDSGPTGSDPADAGPVRTALAVEPRGGMLHVFLPPLARAEDWLGLVAAIEETAAEMGRKVFLEGYPPPYHPGLVHFSITPDPGVIEVNTHPAASWDELHRRTEALYEEARQVGLAAEKFNLDGRHVGTGGGNHVVMGGSTPAESPFLRRPDLLKSIVSFWHNHPSLSYLFSGQFIGPTSQHPRVDEARSDSVGELEIALRRVTEGGEVPPWMTDRLFRNLLIDVTGNTHRAEFCIDKLFDPASAGGRCGLVEFRGFEMPPHARMSLVQQLLLRAAVAAFWASPYDRRLIRWGTRLHDQFMLPHYVAEDFGEVLEEIAGLGFALDPAWFAPHQEFRFPGIGRVVVRGMELELRHALEPWHVMGEEAAAGGAARYVDSSVERVQVKVSGWVGERFVLACNGIAVPLSATGRAGEHVAGIRFKAWQPPSALHPTIPAQVPLVFDIHDTWSGRAVGGCTYHVAHPGGRAHETFPVNANEAEARRLARFLPMGHTPGPAPPPREGAGVADGEHPRTLDLRRFA